MGCMFTRIKDIEEWALYSNTIHQALFIAELGKPVKRKRLKTY